jgi:hypothetical protein
MSVTRSATSNFPHVHMLAALAAGLGGPFAGILFLIALFSHSHLFGRAAVFALATSVLGVAVLLSCSAYRLFLTESWSTLTGQRMTRGEQPAQFARWLALHGLLAAIHGAAAAWLMWIAIVVIH